jgi:gp16 family phage-associated protein
MNTTQKVLTPEQVKAKFAAEGKTFSAWAEERGYSRFDVYRVMNGSTKGRRGKGHKIAVELGIKAAA